MVAHSQDVELIDQEIRALSSIYDYVNRIASVDARTEGSVTTAPGDTKGVRALALALVSHPGENVVVGLLSDCKHTNPYSCLYATTNGSPAYTDR